MISAQDPSLFLAEEASVISSWSIVLFGGTASLMLLFLICATHFVRKREAKDAEAGR